MFHVNTALPNDSISAEVPNPAVSPEILKNILLWQRAGATMDDVLRRLRLHMFPLAIPPTTGTLVCPAAYIKSTAHALMITSTYCLTVRR